MLRPRRETRSHHGHVHLLLLFVLGDHARDRLAQSLALRANHREILLSLGLVSNRRRVILEVENLRRRRVVLASPHPSLQRRNLPRPSLVRATELLHLHPQLVRRARRRRDRVLSPARTAVAAASSDSNSPIRACAACSERCASSARTSRGDRTDAPTPAPRRHPRRHPCYSRAPSRTTRSSVQARPVPGPRARRATSPSPPRTPRRRAWPSPSRAPPPRQPRAIASRRARRPSRHTWRRARRRARSPARVRAPVSRLGRRDPRGRSTGHSNKRGAPRLALRQL